MLLWYNQINNKFTKKTTTMTEQIFLSLSVIIGVVLISLRIMKLLKQPMIIGYILAWTIISIFMPIVLQENHAIETFAHIGISFLLFIVWLELNLKIIKDVGKSAITGGVLQVILTSLIGYGLGLLLGFETMTALYLWIGFAFSSTIVILKLLADKGNTETVYGRLSIGILIVQDIIVMLLFVAISTFDQISASGNGLIVASVLLAKIIWLGIGLFLISKYILPKVTAKIAESQEYLFLFSIGRCLILWSIFFLLGFSIEIWALVAGITLASSAYKFEIMSKVKPLKDFFIIMFFVLLGSRIVFPIETKYILPIIVFVLFVLIIKPLIVSLIMWIMWHSKKNSFLTWTALWQISEFSFLLIMIGITSWHIQEKWIISFVTIIGLITIAISSYQILYWHKIFNKIKKNKFILKILPWKKRHYHKTKDGEFDIMLFGYGRFGSELYKSLTPKVQKNMLIIDENPDVIAQLQQNRTPCIYGDAWEIDFINELNLKKTKMVISTIKDYDDIILLIKTIKKHNQKIIIILISHNTTEAVKFYKEGADYIILPHYIWARHASLLLENYGFDITKFIEQKELQLHEFSKNTEKWLAKLLKGMI